MKNNIVMILSTIIYLLIKVGQEDIVVQDVLMREGMKMD